MYQQLLQQQQQQLLFQAQSNLILQAVVSKQLHPNDTVAVMEPDVRLAVSSHDIQLKDDDNEAIHGRVFEIVEPDASATQQTLGNSTVPATLNDTTATNNGDDAAVTIQSLPPVIETNTVTTKNASDSNAATSKSAPKAPLLLSIRCKRHQVHHCPECSAALTELYAIQIPDDSTAPGIPDDAYDSTSVFQQQQVPTAPGTIDPDSDSSSHTRSSCSQDHYRHHSRRRKRRHSRSRSPRRSHRSRSPENSDECGCTHDHSRRRRSRRRYSSSSSSYDSEDERDHDDSHYYHQYPHGPVGQDHRYDHQSHPEFNARYQHAFPPRPSFGPNAYYIQRGGPRQYYRPQHYPNVRNYAPQYSANPHPAETAYQASVYTRTGPRINRHDLEQRRIAIPHITAASLASKDNSSLDRTPDTTHQTGQDTVCNDSSNSHDANLEIGDTRMAVSPEPHAVVNDAVAGMEDVLVTPSTELEDRRSLLVFNYRCRLEYWLRSQVDSNNDGAKELSVQVMAERANKQFLYQAVVTVHDKGYMGRQYASKAEAIHSAAKCALYFLVSK
jgi:hypothetical protein